MLQETTQQHLAEPTDLSVSLRQLQREMLQKASSVELKSELLQGLAEVLVRYATPEAMFYIRRNEQGELADVIWLRSSEHDSRLRPLTEKLMSVCQVVCQTGEIDVKQHATLTLMAVPIALRGRDPEALGVIFSAQQPTSHLLMLVQMVATHIALWHVLSEGRENETLARESAALVELLDHITAAPNLREACYTLAGELQTYLQCSRVAVGLRIDGKEQCALLAISGVSQFDKHSSLAHAIETAMDEAVLRQDVTTWPVENDSQRHAVLAHKTLCSLADANAVVTIPLYEADGSVVGALTLLDNTDSMLVDASRFVRAAEKSFATSLLAAQRREGSHLARLIRAIDNGWRTWKGKVALGAIGIVLAAMMIPLPYMARCACQIEPVTRRFVAAPFEGTLEESLVKPGDMVHKGDVLARMDEREVRWKRASVAADQKQAMKRRDAAQVAHDYSVQQIAQLQIERLDLELQLLDYRAENLKIKSPVDGIVTSGDLERAEGAPLTIGQVLFEIAPLKVMIVEVAVPDNEISHVTAGQTIQVRLDAYPDTTWQAVMTKIHSRSEIRDQENVFIGEAELDNSAGRLRPGMKGRAKIETQQRLLGWILFHNPWEYVTKKLSW